MPGPEVPEEFSWARAEERESSHPIEFAAKIRYAAGFHFFGGLLVGLGVLTLLVTVQEGPTVKYTAAAVLILGGLATIVAGVVVAGRLVSRVDVYPEGLLWCNRGEWAGARWEDITKVYRTEIYVNGSLNQKFLTVTSRDGETAAFHFPLRDWDLLAEVILSETTARLAPAAVERFQAGTAVTFGKVSLSRDAVTVDKVQYPIADLGEVEIGYGYVTFKTTGKKPRTVSVAFAELPNYMVFLELLRVSDAPRPTLIERSGKRRPA
jgi:hypothetical protein